ncbi:MAG TPA: MjaI family restriction endonuclease [Flavobacteriaceae bacterium]|nr:MjaI family restriction endonuclease [Flavobacteriaceae bacterium]
MKIRIKHSEVRELLAGKEFDFPKYTTQIMNLANQNSQGTRSKVVGQMSDLIQEFEGKTIEEWQEWYFEKHPDSLEVATDKVWEMVKKLKDAISDIDKELVEKWVEELVIVKTFAGLKFQEAILIKLSKHFDKPYRLAQQVDERQGIDGFLGESPISIKPITYKAKKGLNEFIKIPIVFFSKNKERILIEFDDEEFHKVLK